MTWPAILTLVGLSVAAIAAIWLHVRRPDTRSEAEKDDDWWSSQK